MQSIGLQKIIPGVLLSFVVALGFFSQSSIAASHKVLNLTILHTNDFHARFRPISKYDNNCSAESNAEGKCFGGSARLITAIEDARSRHENTVLLDVVINSKGLFFITFIRVRLQQK